MQVSTDTKIREMARKRVDFRIHLVVYCVTNAALWIIWYFTGKGYLWPIWPMTGWGIGVVFNYLFDYRSFKSLWEEEEYNKLKNKANQSQHVIS